MNPFIHVDKGFFRSTEILTYVKAANYKKTHAKAVKNAKEFQMP
jgi:hypothetical protein